MVIVTMKGRIRKNDGVYVFSIPKSIVEKKYFDCGQKIVVRMSEYLDSGSLRNIEFIVER